MATGMKCSLVGALLNAATALDELHHRVGDDKPDPDDEDGDHRQHYYAFVLREIAGHAEGVRSGKYAVSEFVEHYDLLSEKKSDESAE